MKRIMRGAAATGLVLALFAAGCGDTDSDEADDEIVLQMADLDRTAELAGVTRPADAAADVNAVRRYLAAVPRGDGRRTGRGGDADSPQQAAPAGNPDLAGFEAELGWSVLDVSWYVEHRRHGGRRLRPADGTPASIVYLLLQRQDSLITHE